MIDTIDATNEVSYRTKVDLYLLLCETFYKTFLTPTIMKNFDDKETQIQEICNTIRTASNFDIAARLAYYDIQKLVRESYYDGFDAGRNTMNEIYAKNQDTINNILKQHNK